MEIIDTGKEKQFNIRGNEDDKKALGEIASKLGGNFNMSIVVREFAQNNRRKNRDELLAMIMGIDDNSLSVHFSSQEIKSLHEIGQATGFEPEHIVENAMRHLLRSPEAITEMLVGRTQRAVDNQLIRDGKEDVIAAQRKVMRTTAANRPGTERKRKVA